MNLIFWLEWDRKIFEKRIHQSIDVSLINNDNNARNIVYEEARYLKTLITYNPTVVFPLISFKYPMNVMFFFVQRIQ